MSFSEVSFSLPNNGQYNSVSAASSALPILPTPAHLAGDKALTTSPSTPGDSFFSSGHLGAASASTFFADPVVCDDAAPGYQQHEPTKSIDTTEMSGKYQENVFICARLPPLNARQLNFRSVTGPVEGTGAEDSEPSAGLFLGQLPNTYTGSDIQLLLTALGSDCGVRVIMYDVKLHARDRSCAFVQLNASGAEALLQYGHRVLCDMQCVWVVEAGREGALQGFINRFPRNTLRGIPKKGLVIERLVPQNKSDDGGAHPQSPAILSSQQQQQHSVHAQHLGQVSQPPSSQTQQPELPAQLNFAPAPLRPADQTPYAYQPVGAPLPIQSVPGGCYGTYLPYQPVYYAPPAYVVQHTPYAAPAPPPRPTSLPTTLPSQSCSCGQALALSFGSAPSTCFRCHNAVDPRQPAYWCPSSHVVLCASCGLLP